MSNKISVITVVYNDVSHIRETMESFFSQTWKDKEYIVVDGGSTDGTVEIVRSYADRLAFWCSERDGGIYDAMNKGISHATGDWINFLNSGDSFVSAMALEKVVMLVGTDEVDVIYGDSIELNGVDETFVPAARDYRLMAYAPVYRHGSSLVRAEVQKKFRFDLTKKPWLGYALDWEMIFRMYKAGIRFRKVDVTIQKYERRGTSDNLFLSARYNYLITSQGHFNASLYMRYLKSVGYLWVHGTTVYRWASAFILEYLVNGIVPHIPFWCLRKLLLRGAKVRIGKKSFIMRKNYIMGANRLLVGDYSDINGGCLIDARGGISIGDDVSISHQAKLVTGSHQVNSPDFAAYYHPIIISNHVWLGVGCTVLSGVSIGEGSVVCAGAVVTHDVPPFTVVAGIPAKPIRMRNTDLRYHCIWDSPFT